MTNIPESFQGSAALQFVTSRGWGWKLGTAPNIELDTCPYCAKAGGGHCYVEIHGLLDEDKKRDGLHICQRCGKGGSLYSLKQHLGLIIPGVESRKDWSGAEKTVDTLPDIESLHEALLADEDAMDYLMNGRGFSRDIIVRQKIGLKAKHYFRETGEVRALVYPYLVNSNCVFVHFRTLPTMPLYENKVPKAFSSPKGWEAPLYNGQIIAEGLKEVTFLEGECDTLAALDHGVTDVVGVPGANIRKCEWIDTLDKVAPEKVYICYDKDRVGQKAAQELASRIGIERCWKITLPDFTVTTEDGETRPGKDLNEWFVSGGGTADKFEQLKSDAVLFDVDGVSSSGDAVQEFLDDLLGKGTIEAKYKSQWSSFNNLLRFNEGDVIDILAPEKVGKTTTGLNLIEHMVDNYGDNGLVMCLEMTKPQMARKWISYIAQIEDNIPKTPEEAKALTAKFIEAIPKVQSMAANREGDLYFCYPKYKTVDDIYKLIRECIRRYGVKWVMLDNLQRLCDTTLGSKGRTQHLSEISKVTSQIAKDYNIQMIRILQPHRIGEGKMVTTDSVDGASQIAKDCDCMITLHRKRIDGGSKEEFESVKYVEGEGTFENEMKVTVGLSRYSTGGYTTLYYDGAKSTVREVSSVHKAKVLAAANQNVGYENQLKALNLSLKPDVQLGVQEVSDVEITI